MRLLKTGGVLAAGLALACGIWLLAPHDSDEAQRGGAAKPLPRALSWHAGDRQSYELEIQSANDLAAGAPRSGGRLQQRLSGVLHLQVFEVTAERVEVGFQLAQATLSVNGVDREEINRQLSRAFMLELSPTGTPLDWRFTPGLDPKLERLLQEMILSFQFVEPAAAAPSWETEERHGAGTYRSLYRRMDDGSIVKQKLGYLSFAQEGPTAIADGLVQVDSSSFTFLVNDSKSWLDTAEFRELLSVQSGGDALLKAEITGHLRHLEGYQGSFSEIDRLPPGAAPLAVSTTPDLPPVQEKTPVGDLPQPYPTAFRAMLAELVRGGAGRIETLYKIRDYLLEFPDAAHLVVGYLQEHHLVDRSAADLLHALELAGHPTAQAALLSVMADPQGHHLNRLRAVIALGGVANPTAETVDDLWLAYEDRGSAEREDLSNTAILAIGVLGSTARSSGDGPMHSAITARLVEAASGAPGPMARATVLKAMENTGDESLAGRVQADLDNPSPRVRAAAAIAFGTLAGADSAPDLAGRIETEQVPRVRAALVEGMINAGNADPAALELIAGLAGAETDEPTRLQMAKYLGGNLDSSASGRNTLERMLREDPSRRIRKYLGRVLYKSQPGP
ncbi:hypothetical protein DESUT3_27180 [Desulfuromonas versatilis]|uniref:HEAT repeat domain-containing protein n=1 Tax=Desulfuromonas versatilis TaxID=2802975 RepID=A0ABM8HUP5_9BACT|nr:HEAT repeat domain-containing protein [Desulfuromonas versatilis]BCR05649.1 hypothetical protein DESUT3_27180 [Desulfuromonas versatilis]